MDRMAVSVAEAARLLGLSKSSAYRAVKYGMIPTGRLGGRLLVPVAALERILETRQSEAIVPSLFVRKIKDLMEEPSVFDSLVNRGEGGEE